jgi:hypothetical protein
LGKDEFSLRCIFPTRRLGYAMLAISFCILFLSVDEDGKGLVDFFLEEVFFCANVFILLLLLFRNQNSVEFLQGSKCYGWHHELSVNKKGR